MQNMKKRKKSTEIATSKPIGSLTFLLDEQTENKYLTNETIIKENTLWNLCDQTIFYIKL